MYHVTLYHVTGTEGGHVMKSLQMNSRDHRACRVMLLTQDHNNHLLEQKMESRLIVLYKGLSEVLYKNV